MHMLKRGAGRAVALATLQPGVDRLGLQRHGSEDHSCTRRSGSRRTNRSSASMPRPKLAQRVSAADTATIVSASVLRGGSAHSVEATIHGFSRLGFYIVGLSSIDLGAIWAHLPAAHSW